MRVLTPEEMAEMQSIRWWHRIAVGISSVGNKLVYTPGEVWHGPDGENWATERFGMPNSLIAKSVLDVGAWDGYFSFLAERRGAAEVLAVDVPKEDGGNWGGTAGFDFAKRMLDSKVQFQPMNVMALSEDLEGKQFDIVLCYGVLYHVLEPFTAIRELFAATAPGGMCIIETARHPSNDLATHAAWVLRPGHEGDPTNFWYPSVAGLRAACAYAGFRDFEVVHDMGSRITVRCQKPAKK